MDQLPEEVEPSERRPMSGLPPIPRAEGWCVACGNPTLLINTPHPTDGQLPMPGLPVGVVACCFEGCEALYRAIGSVS